MSKFPFKKKTLALLTELLEEGINKQANSILFKYSDFTGNFTTAKSSTESAISLHDLYNAIKEMELNNFRRYVGNIYPWELDGFYPNTEEAKRQREWEKIKPHINMDFATDTYKWTGWRVTTPCLKLNTNSVINFGGSTT